ncbi:uncharacterized protein MONOS_10287 [Monocercomonoides exilis]|uniref:uncharacterized protein n=1 Tax=Monocercomonoides exilis TaxID=2049356 RepID=UPI003559A019|nr:hypothetical protein MONOS_10287 [Monocercomonoides exilis]
MSKTHSKSKGIRVDPSKAIHFTTASSLNDDEIIRATFQQFGKVNNVVNLSAGSEKNYLRKGFVEFDSKDYVRLALSAGIIVANYQHSLYNIYINPPRCNRCLSLKNLSPSLTLEKFKKWMNDKYPHICSTLLDISLLKDIQSGNQTIITEFSTSDAAKAFYEVQLPSDFKTRDFAPRWLDASMCFGSIVLLEFDEMLTLQKRNIFNASIVSQALEIDGEFPFIYLGPKIVGEKVFQGSAEFSPTQRGESLALKLLSKYGSTPVVVESISITLKKHPQSSETAQSSENAKKEQAAPFSITDSTGLLSFPSTMKQPSFLLDFPSPSTISSSSDAMLRNASLLKQSPESPPSISQSKKSAQQNFLSGQSTNPPLIEQQIYHAEQSKAIQAASKHQTDKWNHSLPEASRNKITDSCNSTTKNDKTQAEQFKSKTASFNTEGAMQNFNPMIPIDTLNKNAPQASQPVSSMHQPSFGRQTTEPPGFQNETFQLDPGSEAFVPLSRRSKPLRHSSEQSKTDNTVPPLANNSTKFSSPSSFRSSLPITQSAPFFPVGTTLPPKMLGDSHKDDSPVPSEGFNLLEPPMINPFPAHTQTTSLPQSYPVSSYNTYMSLGMQTSTSTNNTHNNSMPHEVATAEKLASNSPTSSSQYTLVSDPQKASWGQMLPRIDPVQSSPQIAPAPTGSVATSVATSVAPSYPFQPPLIVNSAAGHASHETFHHPSVSNLPSVTVGNSTDRDKLLKSTLYPATQTFFGPQIMSGTSPYNTSFSSPSPSPYANQNFSLFPASHTDQRETSPALQSYSTFGSFQSSPYLSSSTSIATAPLLFSCSPALSVQPPQNSSQPTQLSSAASPQIVPASSPGLYPTFISSPYLGDSIGSTLGTHFPVAQSPFNCSPCNNPPLQLTASTQTHPFANENSIRNTFTVNMKRQAKPFPLSLPGSKSSNNDGSNHGFTAISLFSRSSSSVSSTESSYSASFDSTTVHSHSAPDSKNGKKANKSYFDGSTAHSSTSSIDFSTSESDSSSLLSLHSSDRSHNSKHKRSSSLSESSTASAPSSTRADGAMSHSPSQESLDEMTASSRGSTSQSSTHSSETQENNGSNYEVRRDYQNSTEGKGKGKGKSKVKVNGTHKRNSVPRESLLSQDTFSSTPEHLSSSVTSSLKISTLHSATHTASNSPFHRSISFVSEIARLGERHSKNQTATSSSLSNASQIHRSSSNSTSVSMSSTNSNFSTSSLFIPDFIPSEIHSIQQQEMHSYGFASDNLCSPMHSPSRIPITMVDSYDDGATSVSSSMSSSLHESVSSNHNAEPAITWNTQC